MFPPVLLVKLGPHPHIQFQLFLDKICPRNECLGNLPEVACFQFWLGLAWLRPAYLGQGHGRRMEECEEEQEQKAWPHLLVSEVCEATDPTTAEAGHHVVPQHCHTAGGASWGGLRPRVHSGNIQQRFDAIRVLIQEKAAVRASPHRQPVACSRW